jgi:multiple sugar transport system ATP-binding protein
MNLQTAALTDGGARLAGAVIPLSAPVRAAAARDGLTEIVLGIRPEHLHLSTGSAAGTVNLTGEILLVEELGADALMHVRLAEDGGTVVARTEGRTSPAPGQPVSFRVQPDNVFAFNPVTGARLAG